MAIAFDATSEPTGGSFHASAGSASWTHTPVGTPTLVIVAGSGNAATFNVTGVSYGGTSMFANKVSQLNSTSGLYTFIFYLFNPPAGPQTVAMTSTTGGDIWVSAQTYTGSGTIGNSNTGQDTGTASSLGISLTAAANTSWFLQAAIGNTDQQTSASGGGATWVQRGTTHINQPWDSNGAVSSGASTVTSTWAGGQGGISMSVAEILAASAGGGTTVTPRLLTLMVG